MNTSFDCPVGLLERLRPRYAEPHRRYHTWEHVLACFDALACITTARLPEVELALLFHDAIYEPLSPDNERRSADLLVEEGRRFWMDEGLLQRASHLVLATRHEERGRADEEGGVDAPEACIVLDADLSILGAEPATFDAYERQVREEFACVDDASWAVGRRRVLVSFLERAAIYTTRRGFNLWEARARENIEHSQDQLPVGHLQLPLGLHEPAQPSHPSVCEGESCLIDRPATFARLAPPTR